MEAAKDMQPAADYVTTRALNKDDAIRKVQQGELNGMLIDGKWYISTLTPEEIAELDTENKPYALMPDNRLPSALNLLSAVILLAGLICSFILIPSSGLLNGLNVPLTLILCATPILLSAFAAAVLVGLGRIITINNVVSDKVKTN